MKLKYILMTGVLTAMSLTSCGDDFFEQYPSNSITEGNHYNTDDDFNQSVRGCYQRLKSATGFFLNELSYRSDECILESMATSTQDRYNLDNFVEDASNGICEDQWKNWYNAIYRCNDVLGHMNGRTDLPNYDKYRGELLFLRSWFYFSLYRTFGVVPLTRTVATPSDAKLIPRCTKEEMLQLLSEDLKEAATLLPETRSAEVGRVTATAAYALLAKVYLTFDQPADAKNALDEAMKGSYYGMESTTARAFDVNNKMNKEIIFAVYYNKTNDQGHGLWYTSNTLVMADINNPTQAFKSIYSADDNRLNLLTDYTPVGNLYAIAKWYDTYDAVYTTVVGNDFPLIRYADVVLMYAEALASTNLGDALTWLNKTRTRAGLAELTTAEVPDKTTFIKELANERGREFALEGQRWFDLVRLGLAIKTMSDLGYKIEDRNLLMPIPQSQLEIVNNDKILWQNPGF
ncbi:MAG: RagB/SusD family nutrient uptake outer membrane protein [Muribaculum sp.]|nr:RagB/SusD family nutrient uptake outer membrane protein [Muribaculum sp.]